MSDVFWMNFKDWVSAPYFYAAVMFPFLVSVLCLVRHFKTPSPFKVSILFASLAITTILSCITGFWSEKGLHLFPMAGIFITGLVLSFRQSATLVFPFCFFSLFFADLALAYNQITFPYGIGGAGFGDGLFAMPVFFALVTMVANRLPETLMVRPKVPTRIQTWLMKAT